MQTVVAGLDDDRCPSPEALASLLTGGGADDDAVAAHLQGCADCRRTLADAADVGDEIEHARRGSVLGRYTIVDTLGVGGMGIVYLAHDAELERDVAMKLALRTDVGIDDLQRLHGEAKSMARLSHPNVVTVYDVGWLGPHLFLVMEYVPGQPLSRWLQSEPNLTAIVETFVAAGEGLLAIHRAGVLHGDFKASNAIVGDDGLVRVIDFGLAGRSDDPLATLAAPSSDAIDRDPSSVAIADPGVVHSGPSATGDAFAFASALLLALCGVVPSDPGWSTALRRVAVPKSVKRQLRATLLSPHEETALPRLVATLAATTRPKWRRATPLVVTTLAVGLGVTWWRLQPPTAAEACANGSAAAPDVWDQARKRRVRERFVAHGGAFGSTMFDAVDATLADYAKRWTDREREACLLAHPQPVDDDTQACIEGQHGALLTVTDLLADADATTVASALRIVDALPDLDACDERGGPTTDPRYAQQLHKVLALRYAKRFDDGLVAAQTLVDIADASGDVRTSAEAALELAHVLMRTLQPERAQEQLTRAVRLGTEAGDTKQVARAYVAQASVLAIGLGRFEDGIRSLDTAAALFDAPEDGPRAAIDRMRANLLMYAGRYDACAESARNALDAVQREQPDLPRRWVQDLTTLATCSSVGGDHTISRERAAQAMAITRRTYGDHHPAFADAVRTAGVVARNAGDDNAIELLGDAVALYTQLEEQGTGKRAELTQTLNNLATALSNKSRYDEAIAVRHQVLARVDTLAKFPEKRLRARVLLTQDLMAQQRFDEANLVLDQADAIVAAMPQPHPHLQSGVALNRGIIADRHGDGATVIEAFERARALLLPMKEEADIRDNVLPYITSAADWYRRRTPREQQSATARILDAATAARRSPDICVRAIVLTRAAQVVADDDPRASDLRREAAALQREPMPRNCYLAVVVPAVGLTLQARDDAPSGPAVRNGD